MVFFDENIAYPGKCRLIRYDPGKPNLLLAFFLINAEANRIPDRFLDNYAWAILGPISSVQPLSDKIKVESLRVGANEITFVFDVHDPAKSKVSRKSVTITNAT